MNADSTLLHSGFRASVRRFPDNAALSLNGGTWSYRELDGLARLWASALTTLEKRPRRVGVLGHRSLVTYAGFLAALYAGATVVPLNKKYPAHRNREILERAEVDVVLADPGAQSQLPALLDGMADAPGVLLPESDQAPAPLADRARTLTRADLDTCQPLAEPVAADGADTAYLLFTSGSTGRPKGVPVTHANAAAFLAVNADRYDFTADDRFTNTFDHTFDLSVFDLFMAWGSGARLVPMDTSDLLRPLEFVREHHITVWFSVPSVAMFQDRRGALEPGSLLSLRWSLFCGEALPVSTARAWQAAAPGSRLENLYGPTEATVACLVHRWDDATSPDLALNGIVPIGSPYPGMAAAVLAEDGSPVPDGESGELCLSGAQVFEGYLNAPELTRAAFHTTVSPDGEVSRWYRTGDLARRTPRGEYRFVGRLDTQVKILGHRVETGEVEAHLLRREGVAQAVVVAVPGEDDTTVLAAVLAGDDLDVEETDERLRETLPPYMIPLTYHVVDAFPLNSNGKVDRRVLREQVVSGLLEPILL
ncbi:amino acid adenylation domain-containing protein [Streptomyces alkaliterrae]|uniref:Amino acid adenylation domain-containing protein n=1 Tax=Streptomyces alkaliterrae TaxID=2213162 RepID=A0A5P0YJP3_9ACTN|nr:amino acid adenylation domain-containing protein [Streptomyces alkaliterrae]MBB1252308.1 amino acid adenylation domain-containing protein [Streptomyces alkaliterrae]MBB1258109.1 amino acid adenylation domain-containing protein [Streptomyces alkaliterrae]MQS00535.1 amino acid adenylation domain-containing protein [Streptomyces alkaliterrae]